MLEGALLAAQTSQGDRPLWLGVARGERLATVRERRLGRVSAAPTRQAGGHLLEQGVQFERLGQDLDAVLLESRPVLGQAIHSG